MSANTPTNHPPGESTAPVKPDITPKPESISEANSNNDSESSVKLAQPNTVQNSAEPEEHTTPKAPVMLEDPTSIDLIPSDSAAQTCRLNLVVETIDGDDTADPWPAEDMMFDVLIDYLQPDTKLSVHDAAKSLDDILTGVAPKSSDDYLFDEETSRELREEFGNIIWKLVKQIPHNHKSQDKLLLLIDVVENSPEWEDPFRWALSDNIPSLRRPKAGMTPQQECEAYISVTAFAARCVADNKTWPRYHNMFNSLEESLNPEKAKTRVHGGIEEVFLPAHVAAAAQWIVHAGEWVWGCICWGKDQFLNNTDILFGPDVWVAWMQGYNDMETDDPSMQFWAKTIASRMKEIMTGHGYTAATMIKGLGEDDKSLPDPTAESQSQTVASAPVTGHLDNPQYGIEKNHPLTPTVDFLRTIPEDCEWHIFNVHNNYLQPTTKLSAREAALCIDALMPFSQPLMPISLKDLQVQVSNHLFGYARQIPHDHESQAKLIRLMQAFQELPISQTVSNRDDNEQVPFWRFDSFEGWDQMEYDAAEWANDGYSKSSECINTHSFLARLATARIMSKPRLTYGFDCIQHAASRARSDGEAHPESGFRYVIAAAQWIEHAGALLWDEIRWGKVTATTARVPKRTSCHKVDEVYFELPPAKWIQWMRDFEQTETEHAEAKFWAQKAAKKMHDLIVASGRTTEEMENWDPEKDTIHGGILDNPDYAHLFKGPGRDAE